MYLEKKEETHKTQFKTVSSRAILICIPDFMTLMEIRINSHEYRIEFCIETVLIALRLAAMQGRHTETSCPHSAYSKRSHTRVHCIGDKELSLYRKSGLSGRPHGRG